MSVHHGVWLQAWGAQQRVEMGEPNKTPQGSREDLNSSIITESQAAAMSPDCRVPAEFFPPCLIYPLFHPLSLLFWSQVSQYNSAVPGLWLLCGDRGQIHTQTEHLLSHRHGHTRAEVHKHTATQIQIDRDRNSLLSTCRTCFPYV